MEKVSYVRGREDFGPFDLQAGEASNSPQEKAQGLRVVLEAEGAMRRLSVMANGMDGNRDLSEPDKRSILWAIHNVETLKLQLDDLVKRRAETVLEKRRLRDENEILQEKLTRLNGRSLWQRILNRL